MALIFDGSANTIANLAVGGLPDGVVDEDTRRDSDHVHAIIIGEQ